MEDLSIYRERLEAAPVSPFICVTEPTKAPQDVVPNKFPISHLRHRSESCTLLATTAEACKSVVHFSMSFSTIDSLIIPPLAAEWQRERGQNDSDSAISVGYG